MAAFVGSGIGVARRCGGGVGARQCGLFRPMTAGVVPARLSGGFQGIHSTPARTTTTPTMVAIQEVARIANVVYAVLIGVGGVGAFLRTKSKPSLIAGVSSGISLGVAYQQNSTLGAMVVALVLTAVFILRFTKTKKFMPSGLLCLLSLAFSGIFASSLLLA